MTWTIFKGKDRKWYFHLRAQNGKVLLQSEAYNSKQSAIKGINSIRVNANSSIIDYED